MTDEGTPRVTLQRRLPLGWGGSRELGQRCRPPEPETPASRKPVAPDRRRPAKAGPTGKVISGYLRETPSPSNTSGLSFDATTIRTFPARIVSKSATVNS